MADNAKLNFRTTVGIAFWSQTPEDAEGWVDVIKQWIAENNPDAEVTAATEFFRDGKPVLNDPTSVEPPASENVADSADDTTSGPPDRTP